MERPHYKTVVISDVHIGAPHSKVREVTEFLSSVDCDRLIMRSFHFQCYYFPLAKLGDVAYNLLLKFNNVWNKARQKRGKEYYSLSAVVKHKVKQAVSAISGFESDLASYAKAKGCDGIICGHIHHPEDKMLKGGIHYLNSGDWVESLTALVEDYDGNWRIARYQI